MSQYCQKAMFAFLYWIICGFLYMDKVIGLSWKSPLLVWMMHILIKQIVLNHFDYNANQSYFYIIIIDCMNTMSLRLVNVIINI